MNQKLQNLFFLFLLGTIGAKAQPVITAAGFNPQIGDSYKYQFTKAINLNPDFVGANKVWDFSNLVDSSSAFILSFVSPKGQPGVDSFPTSNIAEFISIDTTSVAFLKTSSTNFGQIGQYLSPTIDNGYQPDWINYTPLSTVMIYPMTFNTNYTDSLTLYDFENFGSLPEFYDTLIGIGYGTLKLPTGTYNNVLCIYSNGGGYSFVTNGVHYALLTLNIIYGPFGNIINGWYQPTYYAGTALPIEISSFTASWQNKMPYLQWDAANTENTKQFNIQRSVDGRSFSTVGQVGVSGGSSYHFEDNYIPTTTVYYRIEQVDKNGQTFYSSTAQLTVNSKQLTVYPNPAKDVTIVQGKHIVSVQVINNSGRVVSVTELNDATNPSIKTNNLAAGIYYLHIKTTDGGESVVSFVKQ